MLSEPLLTVTAISDASVIQWACVTVADLEPCTCSLTASFITTIWPSLYFLFIVCMKNWTVTCNITAMEWLGQTSKTKPCVPKVCILCPKSSYLLSDQCLSGRYPRMFMDSLAYWHSEAARAWSLGESRETWRGLSLHLGGSYSLCHLTWMDLAGWPLLLLGQRVDLRPYVTWKKCVLWKERKYLILM